jgi:hypothetical protein
MNVNNIYLASFADRHIKGLKVNIQLFSQQKHKEIVPIPLTNRENTKGHHQAGKKSWHWALVSRNRFSKANV